MWRIALETKCRKYGEMSFTDISNVIHEIAIQSATLFDTILILNKESLPVSISTVIDC